MFSGPVTFLPRGRAGRFIKWADSEMRDYSSAPKELETAAVALLLLSLGILSFSWIAWIGFDLTLEEILNAFWGQGQVWSMFRE